MKDGHEWSVLFELFVPDFTIVYSHEIMNFNSVDFKPDNEEDLNFKPVIFVAMNR